METVKEAVIKVRFDDYKMISNILKNEPGITQKSVVDMLKQMVDKVDIESIVTRKIERFVGRGSNTWRLREQVRQKFENLNPQN